MDVSSGTMLAIIEQMDVGCNVDNTTQFLLLMLLKVCLDSGTLYLCCLKPLVSFLNLCSVSIVLVDLILAFFMVTTIWLEVHTSHMALCFFMAHFSAAYSVLPLPMMCLGVLDYYLEGTCTGNKRYKLLRNGVLTLLLWTLSGVYAFVSVQARLLEQDRNMRYLVCEIEESKVVTCTVVVLFTLLVCALLPYWPTIPRWIKEADQISQAREEIIETQTSDLRRILTPDSDTKCIKESFLERAVPCPPMWLSLTLGFSVFWMPYLAVTSICVVFDFGVPAYISVNLLWVQCMNSLLVGTRFWLRSETQGPYNSLPENVCLWQVYWHLSTGTNAQQLPVSVFNPIKEKRNTLFYV